ncbi:hypothetical protein KIW84_034861 [Lathyrus oleraceus]|uniref:Uncharacterized protein n=1 Tax=Pisum sativum TaxID=3888 RepID=A0A9D4XZI8_PEA|nr:hypothetical protein KIW84_034861 [Pisum sativum]
MTSQVKSKGKGKASSSRGPLDLSGFSPPRVSKQELGLSDLICYNINFYPKLVKVFYSNMVKKKEKLTFVVKGVPISMTVVELSDILEIPIGGHKFVGTKALWEDYRKHAFYYSLSRLSEHMFYNKRKKSFGGDLLERVYWSPAKFSIDDRMLHYFLAYVIVPRFSNHCTITDPEMMLLCAIKNNFRVDWGHTIISHMMSHDEYAEGLPYAYFLTKIFHHFNINMENELSFSMEKPSYMISIKLINRKMGVVYNHRTHEVKYLDIDDEETQPEVHSDEDINPPSEAQPDQPSNQMIMEYL